jgi:hypothetical protein
MQQQVGGGGTNKLTLDYRAAQPGIIESSAIDQVQYISHVAYAAFAPLLPGCPTALDGCMLSK